MDFTLDKKHEMARSLFREFAETKLNLLHRKLMRQNSSRQRQLRNGKIWIHGNPGTKGVRRTGL